jgi:hypothetical protein
MTMLEKNALSATKLQLAALTLISEKTQSAAGTVTMFWNVILVSAMCRPIWSMAAAATRMVV